MIGDTSELNKPEKLIAKYVAKSRFESNRSAGITNSKIGGQSNEETDLEGIGAEMAFCKLFNVYPDLTIGPRSAKCNQDFFDCTVNGYTIDVKATKYPSGRLLAAPWKGEGNPPKCYALMVGKFPTYVFKGFMFSKDLLVPARLGNLGHGPTYIASQDELIGELP